MQLTVLGAGAVRPNPGGACSGYLLETGGSSVLIDCGSGVLSRLLLYRTPADLDAVIVSHDHPDHWLDLIAVQMSLAHAPGPKRVSPLPVYSGPGVQDKIRGAGQVVDDDFWADCSFPTFDPASTLEMGPAAVRFVATSHSRPSWAMRFEAEGRAFVYTADTSYSSAVQELAEGADLLLTEATLGAHGAADSESGHMTAGEAGRLAAGAGVGKLLLTHYFVERGADEMAAAAARNCSIPVLVAKEGEVHVI